MKMKRGIAALLAFSLAAGCALAEEPVNAPVPSTEITLQQRLSGDDIRMFVELLFAAATGTTAEQETALRAEMTDEEKEARNAENAEYRAKTLPWLIAAFQPEAREDDAAAQSDGIEIQADETGAEGNAPAENADNSDDTLNDADVQPVYTTVDSYEAFREREQGQAFLVYVEQLGGADAETAIQLTREICALWMEQIDHEELRGMNEDYSCWIYAPDTQIDYPIVHGADNSYYLKHLFNGAYNASGTLFVDYRNLSDFQDPNTLIYGHHMRNDSMFGTLTDYAEQAYFESHPFALIMSEEEIFLLEFFAGYTTRHDDHCYDIAISDEEDMAAFVEEALRKSDFASDVRIWPTDRLVTLSTCAYAFENARYILIGKIVPVWEAPAEGGESTETGIECTATFSEAGANESDGAGE